MRTALTLFALVALVSAHGRVTKPTTRDMLNNRRVDEMNAPVQGLNDPAFICRGFGKGPNQATLNAGGSFNFQWSYSAAHVGDCQAYLSYDGERTWFKIWELFDCKAANERDVQVNLPSWLPSCPTCVLRWEWIALHQWPNIELYSQCIDVEIRGGGSSLPATFPIPGHIPPNNGVAPGYRNPFGSGDRRITGPAIATGPNGTPVPAPGPGPAPTPTPGPGPAPTPNGACYANPGLAKNQNGPISGTCAGGNRCANEQCCSEFGYCGTTNEYCNSKSQGDWRTTGCSVPSGQCYKSGPGLNLDGPILPSSACGQNAPGSRCPNGNCCSQFGFCGTSNDHCNQNQGDWRLTGCSGANNIAPRDEIANGNVTDDGLLGSASKVAAVGILAALAAL